MTDRIALIAGVGGATGAALSRRFAQGGYRVAMIARNAERLAELETQIPRARGYPCDVADLNRLGETVERVQAELGAPHVLVHNAVAATFAKFLDASVDSAAQAAVMREPASCPSAPSTEPIFTTSL